MKMSMVKNIDTLGDQKARYARDLDWDVPLRKPNESQKHLVKYTDDQLITTWYTQSLILLLSLLHQPVQITLQKKGVP